MQRRANKKLYRSRKDEMLCGVCGGIADWLGVQSVWIRLAFAIGTILWGSGIMIYIALAIIIPKEPRRRDRFSDDFDAQFDHTDGDYRAEYHTKSKYKEEYSSQKAKDIAETIKRTVSSVVDEVATEIQEAFAEDKEQDRRQNQHNGRHNSSQRPSSSESEAYIREEVERLKRKMGTSGTTGTSTYGSSDHSTETASADFGSTAPPADDIRNKMKESEWDSRFNQE